MFETDYDIEKVSNFQGCGNCVFCLSKCPKCGSPKVEIKYHRQYFEDGSIESCTFVKCDCSKTVVKRKKLPEGITGINGEPYREICNYKYFNVPDLTKCIDDLFDDIKPIKPVEVKLMYLLENDTDDELRLSLYERDSNVKFKEKLPIKSIMNIENEKDENGHKNIDLEYVTLA